MSKTEGGGDGMDVKAIFGKCPKGNSFLGGRLPYLVEDLLSMELQRLVLQKGGVSTMCRWNFLCCQNKAGLKTNILADISFELL